MNATTLAQRLGVEGTGLVILTCPKCGAHTAGKPPVACWACSQESKPKEAPK